MIIEDENYLMIKCEVVTSCKQMKILYFTIYLMTFININDGLNAKFIEINFDLNDE